MKSGRAIVVNGWTLFAHPVFLSQLTELVRRVEELKQKDTIAYTKKNATKRLAAIAKLIFEVIPQDPTRVEYRQGSTLGDAHRHWLRAKFFSNIDFFRYHAASKIIVFAWVNDENSKRAYESNDDAYRVFRKMLESGHPPDDWQQLLDEARKNSGTLSNLLGENANK